MNTMVFSPTVSGQVILMDLVNSLLAEQYILESEVLTKDQAQRLCIQRFQHGFETLFDSYSAWSHFAVLFNSEQTACLILPLKQGLKQRWQMHVGVSICKLNMDEAKNYHVQKLSALQLFDFMQQLPCFNSADASKLADFRADLKQAILQAELSQQHQLSSLAWLKQHPADLFIQLEQYAALRDRPYHPLAKLKDGFSPDEYQYFSPEFAQDMDVHWVAVNKEKLVYGKDITEIDRQQPARIFLNAEQFLMLKQECDDKALGDDYLAIPLHAWQFKHVLSGKFSEELQHKDIIPLAFQSNGWYASSSLRSLLSATQPQDSLKLPLAVKSLGSLRFLPIVKMINGQKNQQLLQLAKQKDEILKKRLWLCDENQWWAYLPEQQENLTPDNLILFNERPMHLAAQRRRIPAELLQAPYQIIPMASLGQLMGGQGCVFDLILKWQNLTATPQHVCNIFAELCRDFFEVNLRLFRLGLMGEIHGQNICIVLEQGQFAGFMLRDHDSVRIYQPWMQQHGLPDPEYLSPHDFRITLYHDSVESLILYLQTLGIQVNLASILETVAEFYQIDSADLWRIMAQQLQQALNDVPFTDTARTELKQILFDSELWPYKQLIRPLLEQDNRVGSMPSSMGTVPNVFRSIV
ncbi:MAG: Aerobactin synthase [Acinetobacter bereziniae]|uniref:Aerobactin synthase n=1 Tax=Acinetobacter bereziniae TaxID=106648 RepID=A0A833PEL2_ACIBZ|nr:MAG: Aerobactin synthase [Acinetobacter bereziniae]